MIKTVRGCMAEMWTDTQTSVMLPFYCKGLMTSQQKLSSLLLFIHIVACRNGEFGPPVQAQHHHPQSQPTSLLVLKSTMGTKPMKMAKLKISLLQIRNEQGDEEEAAVWGPVEHPAPSRPSCSPLGSAPPSLCSLLFSSWISINLLDFITGWLAMLLGFDSLGLYVSWKI